jgi:hypothetical protein
LIQRDGSEPFAVHAGGIVNIADFRHDVALTARSLEAAPAHLINACEDRYRFVVAFFAVVVAGRTNLLPAERTAETLRRLQAAYPGTCPITDEAVLLHGASATPWHGCIAEPVTDSAVAAIAFTSGSTGAPQPQRKPWGALRAGARMRRPWWPRCRPGTCTGWSGRCSSPPWRRSACIAARLSIQPICGARWTGRGRGFWYPRRFTCGR